jgi:hypothetical protein
MKHHVGSLIVFALSLVIPAVGFAATAYHKGSMEISNPTQVAGRQLAAGEYRVTWEGTGPTAQVAFLRDGKTIVSALARVKELNQKAPYDSNDVATGPSGQKTLKEIQFAGQQYALEFTAAATMPAKKN